MSLSLPFMDLFAALCGNGMLESMLEPHLKYAGASTVDVGVSFLIFGCCYMLGNVLFGGVCILYIDHHDDIFLNKWISLDFRLLTKWANLLDSL